MGNVAGNNSYAIVQRAVVDNFGAAECRDNKFVILADDRYPFSVLLSYGDRISRAVVSCSRPRS